MVEEGEKGRMALQVLVSHSGAVLSFGEANPRVESLRAWIETTAAIPASRQILMTARGKLVKNLANEAEVFVYDKKYLAAGSQPPTTNDAELGSLREPPSSLADENSLTAWQELFSNRRTWATEALDLAKGGVENADIAADEATVIARSMKVALDNLQSHVTNLQQKFDETHQWAQGILQEQRDILSDWQGSADTLAELPVREDVARILRRSGDPHQPIGTLFDLVNRDGLQAAAAGIEQAMADFESKVQQLTQGMDHLKTGTTELHNQPSHVPEIDTDALLDEAQTLAKRIGTDTDEALQSQDNPKSLASISRKAAVHTRELLPALQAVVEDVNQAYISASESRNAISQNFCTTMQRVATLQSDLSGLTAQIASLDFPHNDQFSTLNRVFQLPLMYGLTLVEATRRTEWTEKMRTEVDTVHEDLSQQTEEEQRRRKKWTASHSDFLSDELNSKDALIDLKASAPRNSWPFVSRDEIFTWVDDLRALQINDVVETVTQKMKELDAPVRKQKPKPFKNGSIHDLSQSAQFPRVEDGRPTHEEKLRLEEKLRASESRVRKLEDLLHRQSQLSRPASGVFVPGSAADFERHTASPGPQKWPGELSRRSSTSLRRLSNNTDEKALVQKIVALEGQVQKLQEEAHAERRSSTESRDKMQEAESIKQDLMANFEAQRQEFEDERQLLDDEVHRLKVKLEEAEEELDRLTESRDHLRNEQDQNNAALQSELDQLRKTAAEAASEAKRKLEASHRDTAAQREKASGLDRQLQQVKEERVAAQTQNMSLANQLRSIEERQLEYVSTLQGVHSNLSPAGSAPEDIRRLVSALEILSEGAAIHARGLDDSLQLATAENKALEQKVMHLEAQMKMVASQKSSAESRVSEMREALEQERHKILVVRSELADERQEMTLLREKFAAGETGSDALRAQLQSEEKKVAELLEHKSEDESAMQALKHEIDALKEAAKEVRKREDAAKKHFNDRGEKAKQLSEKLFHVHDRVVRMVEQFGYAVSRQDDSLVIQRASRLNAANSALLSGGEGSSSMKRTISGSGPTPHYSDPTDLETLYWMSDDDVASENGKYQGFVTALGRLDVDSVLDQITKRYKDIEQAAKKYQKDSRGYREKSHRVQAEAHDKIAYRSFKEGDLALFLPTRNQATRPWAAFNVGAPHYFLREQDVHKLQHRDWLLARISRIEERTVDLSKSLSTSVRAGASDAGSTRSIDDDNPFDLSDGLRWYLIDAAEEKLGAPGTPSVGRSTVIASNVEVKGHMGRTGKEKSSGSGGGNAAMVTKTLHKSLDSRRSSSGSKKSISLKKGEGSSVKDMPAPLAPITSDTDAEGQGEGTSARGPPQLVQEPSASRQIDRDEAPVFDVDGAGAADHFTSTVRRQQDGERSETLERAQLREGRMQSPSKRVSRHQTPMQSPSKQQTPAKAQTWDRLFSVEYRG